MDKRMVNMEELKQVNGGSEMQSTSNPVVDGFFYMGGKVVDGACWLWNGIRSIF